MTIKSSYLLKESPLIHLAPNENATVNLELEHPDQPEECFCKPNDCLLKIEVGNIKVTLAGGTLFPKLCSVKVGNSISLVRNCSCKKSL